MTLFDLAFWIGFIQIIGIDVILSGDNAVVIALVCRGLPRERQKLAIMLGAAAAVVLRIAAALIIFELLALPYLKLIGGGLLLWIAIRLGRSRHQEANAGTTQQNSLVRAIWTVLVADALMSLDNIVAIAGAARGSLLLLSLGLAISIPLVIYGSTLLLRLIVRFPAAITLGAGLIGWVAGDMVAADSFVRMHCGNYTLLCEIGFPVIGIAIVVAGPLLSKRPKPTDSA